MPDPDLISIAEAAEIVGIGRDTVYRLAGAGLFPAAIKIGGRWRVSVPRLRRWLHDEPNSEVLRDAGD